MKTPQIAPINVVNYQSAARLAMVSLDKAGQYAQLNLHAAKIMVELSGQIGTALAEIRDATGMAQLSNKLSVLGAQNALAYSRGVYQIAAATKTDFSQLAAQGWSSATGNVIALTDKVAKEAGSAVAATVIKPTAPAFDQYAKSSKKLLRSVEALEGAAAATVASAASAVATTTKSRKTKRRTAA